MATSKRSSGKSKSGDTRFLPMEWLNVPLSEADEEELEKLYGNPGAAFSWHLDAVKDGYSFSHRYDDKNHTFVATMVQRYGDKNMGLTGRGADPLAAYVSCLYRHQVLLECDWSTAIRNKSNSRFG